MEVSSITEGDVKNCVQLINLLKAGKWELSGPDIIAHTETVKWVHGLAQKMSEHVKGKIPPPQGGFKVKSAGPLPAAPQMKSTGKSKKK